MKTKFKLLINICCVLTISVICSVNSISNAKTQADNFTTSCETETIQTETIYSETQSNKDIDDSIVDELFSSSGFEKNDMRTEISISSSHSNDRGNQQKTYNDDNTKAYIYDRMLNSIDYFSSLQATYYYLPHTGLSYFSTYCIKQGDQPMSKEMIYNESGEFTSRFEFDGTYTALADGKSKLYVIEEDFDSQIKKLKSSTAIVSDLIKERSTKSDDSSQLNENYDFYNKSYVDLENNKKLDFVSKVDSRKRIQYIPEFEDYCYYYRYNSPQLAKSQEQYFPQVLAFGFLSDFNNWKIERVETLLNRQCYIIVGEVTGDYSKKMNTVKFEMCVDSDIGAILNLVCYDMNGNISSFLETYEFTVDRLVNEDIFIDLSKY